MSIDIALIKEHDIALNNGDFVLTGGAKQIAQQVKITLLTFKGEWFLNQDFGVPYLDSILVKNPNRAEIEAVLRAAVKDVPGVSAVPSMKLFINHPARKLKVEIQAQTKEGLETVEVEV